MQKLWARENPDGELPLLGTLEPPEQGTEQVLLCERLSIPGAGSFTREEALPLCSEEEILAALGKEDLSAAECRCLGALVPKKAGVVLGEVLFSHGWYRYHLPVCRIESVKNDWKPLGYLPVSDGHFLVAAKKSHRTGKALLAAGILLLLAAGVLLGFGREAVLGFFRSL